MAKKFKRPTQSWEYVLDRDRELAPEEQSRFLLRPLTVSERAAVHSGLVTLMEGPDGTRQTQSRLNIVGVNIAVQNIVSVENFPSDEPKAWPDSREERLKYLEQLSDDDVQELANEVFAKSTIDTALKN